MISEHTHSTGEVMAIYHPPPGCTWEAADVDPLPLDVLWYRGRNSINRVLHAGRKSYPPLVELIRRLKACLHDVMQQGPRELPAQLLSNRYRTLWNDIEQLGMETEPDGGSITELRAQWTKDLAS